MLIRFQHQLRSIYGTLLLVVVGGLVIPAFIGSYLLIGVREQNGALTSLNASLQRYANILALGMQESLWSMHPDAGRALVESIKQDPAVLQIRVTDATYADFIVSKISDHPLGKIYSIERDVILQGHRIGHVLIEMTDASSRQELHDKQWAYATILVAQLAVSLLLIILFLHVRLIVPLRKLMGFSDRLSKGDFDARLDLLRFDELGRLGGQLEQMRVAIGHLFDDAGQREERFRSIVMQVPGAVFRYNSEGQIEFVSNTIEEISGYPAEKFMQGGARVWQNLVFREDIFEAKRQAADRLREHKSYEIEYRILDAFGTERWVLESGQPGGQPHDTIKKVDGILADITERKRNEMQIQALLTEQAVILDNVLVAVMFVRRRVIISVNRQFETLFDYESREIVGKSSAHIYSTSEVFDKVSIEAYAAISKGESYSDDFLYKRRDGSVFWGTLKGCAMDSAHPEDGSIWAIADISARKRSEEKLRLAAKVFENITDGVIVTDLRGEIVAVNSAFTSITGFAEDEAVGQTPAILKSGRQDAMFYEALWAALGESGFWRGEIWNRRKNGELFLEWLTISVVRDEDGNGTHYVGVFSDITLFKEAQEKLDHLAHHDPLTGLPNRLLFNDRLTHAIHRAKREKNQLALLFIDLDRFKNVNDTLGHHVGDELLKQVSSALSEVVRVGDTLARLGGDEFIMLLEDVDGTYGAGMVAKKMMAVFEKPFMLANHELFVTCSVGISVFPMDGDDLHVLMRNADVAMYQSKEHGRNAYRFYAPEMVGESVKQLRLESLLRHSIEYGQISLDYQAQVDIQSGQLIGVEALARWHHPELGVVPPIKFIPIAEDSGFINQLGAWVLRESCLQMKRWQEAGLHVPKIAVNLSVKQFERGNVVELVSTILEETGLAPHCLQLEVTESVIMNTGDSVAFINGLFSIGVGLAIDDFGTGYSSLAYLKQLPVQTLKIDRSFIQDISTDPNDEAIAIAIIQLGKSLNLSVIAEGVETEEQARFLVRHGCNFAQGFLYSRPMPAQKFLEQWGPQLIDK